MFFYDIFISPIESIVDFVFLFITRKFESVGILCAIIGVSFIINILALPLYNIADSIKAKEAELQKKMAPQIARIKKFFSGDERFMMIQTFYRQNNYHPLYAFKSSLSILIEIPFFIAAFHYLSNNKMLSEVSISFLNFSINLGSPDNLFFVGGFAINILPILMTLINIVSSLIYTKNAPLKEQIQLYGLSVLFLVLLYNSPSGLVIYWICNNIFSLFKNIVQQKKNPGAIFHKIMSVFFIAVTAMFLVRIAKGHYTKPLIVIFLVSFTVIFSLLPLIFKFIEKRNFGKIELFNFSSDTKFFAICCIGLFLMAGFVIPSSIVATSPIEFSCLGATDNPACYVLTAFLHFFGFFVIWPICIYKMFSEKVRKVMTWLFFTLFICSLLNVFVFKIDYGFMSQTFALESIIPLEFKNLWLSILPILSFILVSLLFLHIFNRNNLSKKSYKNIKSVTFTLLFSLCFAEAAVGTYKTDFILKKYNQNKDNLLQAKSEGKAKDIKPVFNMSKTEKNVVVIFLDRGINSFFPRILESYPELKNSYDGFTWYPNTASFGNFTTVGAPAMLGGYEYTPEEINRRENELLRDKHNEATLVMPKLFLDKGWNITITDPPLPNYSEKTDLSAFKKFPEVKVSELAGRYTVNYLAQQNKSQRQVDVICKKQCKNFSILQMLMPDAKKYFYNITKDEINETSFEHQYASLNFFKELTEFSSDKNNFFFIENDATHPDSDTPDWGKDGFLEEAEIRKVYDFKDSKDLVHFRVNALCIRAIGKWLDYLKENEAYDNTRIILVSDHGRGINLEEFKDFTDGKTSAFFTALLCVKDFNSRGKLNVNNDFMMNADTLFLAKEGLDLDDKNPFTKKVFEQNKNFPLNLYRAETTSTTKIYNNNKFNLNKEFCCKLKGNDIFKDENWESLK